MRTLLASTLALGAITFMSTAALATEPAKPATPSSGLMVLTEGQMDKVTAGGGSLIEVGVGDVNIIDDVNVNVLSGCGCKKDGDKKY